MTTTISITNTTIGASASHDLTDANTQRWAAALIATQDGYASDTPAQAIARRLADFLKDQIALTHWYETQQNAPAPITVT